MEKIARRWYLSTVRIDILLSVEEPTGDGVTAKFAEEENEGTDINS
jgi:hypothetical protein